MKKIKQSYPQRRAMLSTPFVPLADAEFQSLVSSGEAIPCQQGTALLVSKWRDGPGLDAATFLAALKSQGSTMEIRRYRHDVHIRVVRGKAPAGASTPARARRSPK
ncbi:MAG: hypothetical protein L3K00_00300 [Thermoplasmata archaeon]|nr:hypothetical protein [Thermoplasmata archaeon]